MFTSLHLLLSLTLIHPIVGDFIYPDFNQTLGLVLNGDASISSCHKAQKYVSNAEQDDEMVTKKSERKEGGLEIQEEISTNVREEGDQGNYRFRSKFGHRDEYRASPQDGCKTRMRLTPSSPSKVGSVFYEKRVPVIKGFDTTFSFQISDQSRICSRYVDPMLSQEHHKSCAVHGGDGFAFVLHSNQDGARALGGDGQQLGYGGISNALAVEFDMWTNVDTQGSNDMFHDHIAIHSASTEPINSKADTMLGDFRPYNLADGKIHHARVQYLPYVEKKYMSAMTANAILTPYLKDNGEGRRLGTLSIFINEGIAKNEPILSIPLNLSILLDLPQGLGYVGFTGSTGDRWQKHDILSWHWCDSNDCRGDIDEIKRMELEEASL